MYLYWERHKENPRMMRGCSFLLCSAAATAELWRRNPGDGRTLVRKYTFDAVCTSEIPVFIKSIIVELPLAVPFCINCLKSAGKIRHIARVQNSPDVIILNTFFGHDRRLGHDLGHGLWS